MNYFYCIADQGQGNGLYVLGVELNQGILSTYLRFFKNSIQSFQMFILSHDDVNFISQLQVFFLHHRQSCLSLAEVSQMFPDDFFAFC